jgi:hypothetical protein
LSWSLPRRRRSGQSRGQARATTTHAGAGPHTATALRGPLSGLVLCIAQEVFGADAYRLGAAAVQRLPHLCCRSVEESSSMGRVDRHAGTSERPYPRPRPKHASCADAEGAGREEHKSNRVFGLSTNRKFASFESPFWANLRIGLLAAPSDAEPGPSEGRSRQRRGERSERGSDHGPKCADRDLSGPLSARRDAFGRGWPPGVCKNPGASSAPSLVARATYSTRRTFRASYLTYFALS